MIASLLLIAAVFTRPMERVSSMDPIHSQSVYDSRAIQLVYETILNVDYNARPYRLTSGYCELPEIAPDGLTYTFKVSKKPVWNDYSPKRSAHDAVRSLERLRDKNNVSPGAWTMKAVDFIKVINDERFEIKLKSRFHVFPWLMAMSYTGVLAPDGKGTGPYELTFWWKNHEMVFTRRGTGECKAVHDGEVFDKVRYLIVDDVSTQWLMFLRGELDFLGAVSRDNWDAVVNRDGKLDESLINNGITLHSMPTLESFYIGVNMKDEVLGKNKYLRQALNCAFNFPEWKKFYNNRILPADGPVPFGVEGRLETPFQYAWNPEKAKELLSKAGYPDGIDPNTGKRLVLSLAIGRASQDAREAGELTAAFFAKIGIRVDLQFMTWDSFLRAVNEGRVQLYMMGWVGDYPDAENFLQLFHSRNVSPGPNHSYYVRKDFDEMYDAALNANSADERNEYWRRCQEIIREDCPWIFTHFNVAYSLSRSTVKNYVPSDFPYGQEYHFREGEKK